MTGILYVLLYYVLAYSFNCCILFHSLLNHSPLARYTLRLIDHIACLFETRQWLSVSLWKYMKFSAYTQGSTWTGLGLPLKHNQVPPTPLFTILSIYWPFFQFFEHLPSFLLPGLCTRCLKCPYSNLLAFRFQLKCQTFKEISPGFIDLISHTFS